jgi:hypothetical protein
MAFNPDQKPDIRELTNCKIEVDSLLKEKNVDRYGTGITLDQYNELVKSMNEKGKDIYTTYSCLKKMAVKMAAEIKDPGPPSNKAEKIQIDIYSYLDDIRNPTVKIDLNTATVENVKLDVKNFDKLETINSSTSKDVIPRITANVAPRFNDYFNRLPNEGAKTTYQKYFTTPQTTVANAIAELIKKRTELNKGEVDPFILFLRGQEQGKVLRLVQEFQGKATYDYYSQLVGKQATSEEVSNNFNLIIKELDEIKKKVHSDSVAKRMATQGAAQESILDALKTNVSRFSLKDKSGAFSQKNLDNYVKNIKGLSDKINPDTGLLTGKNFFGSGFDPKKIMGQKDIEDAVLTLPLFGGKTRKNKKSKTQKRGRRNKKTRKH